MAEGEVDEVLAEFLAESLEGLDAIEQAFVVLEQRPKDEATLAAIFRTMHSLKAPAASSASPISSAWPTPPRASSPSCVPDTSS